MATSSYVGKEVTVYRSDDGVVSTATRKLPELKPHDILVRLTHSGVCHTDTTFCEGKSKAALGHEGVGIVEAVGSLVSQVKIGDRVGGGFHRAACGHCKYCLSGRDILCYDRVIFGEADFDNGTFSPYYIARESFLHPIPDSMPSEIAAPLQCAGATVYSAIKATVKPEQRVGIIGIGGLGHLAIQYAAKMGAHVVVYSTSADKEEEARSFGAKEFYLVSEMYEKQKAPIEVFVIAGTRYPDWEKVMCDKFLARDGWIVPLTAPVIGPLSFPAYPMLFFQYHVYHSLVASRNTHREMLEFSARNEIKPLIQVVKHNGLDTIKKVFDDLNANKVRYRAVLEF